MIPQNVGNKLESIKFESLRSRNILYYEHKRQFVNQVYACKTPDDVWNLKRFDVYTVLTREPELIDEKVLGDLYPVFMMVYSDYLGTL